MALGLTQQLPETERYIQSREYTEHMIAVFMGGRCAEEIVFGTQTTGAGDDINRATDLARKMVCEWGMSESMGPLSFGSKEEAPFLGRDVRERNFSEETSISIDQEIKRIVTSNYERAKNLLQSNRDKLDAMAKYLLEYESLEASQLDQIMLGEVPVPPIVVAPQPASDSATTLDASLSSEKMAPTPSEVARAYAGA